MRIEGKVHCLFEQSGTFKNEFKKLGIDAEDYDIQNNFGETDHVIDLFGEIDAAFERERETVFDRISKDDLSIAFFPCVFFCENNQLYFTGVHRNLERLGKKERVDVILKRSKDRARFYEAALKMFAIYDIRGLRLIVENPFAAQHFLVGNFPYSATFIDRNRMARGDYYNKPTQYWFINCEPTHGETFQRATKHKKIASGRPGAHGGLCSEDRSTISPDYARNFICDFIIGKPQKNSQLGIWDFEEEEKK